VSSFASGTKYCLRISTLTASFEQHLLFDASKARRVLGWTETDPLIALRASVDWHLAHPPELRRDSPLMKRR
jgi:hypothetical protein